MINFRKQIAPNEYVESVYDIHLDKLWKAGKRLILSDLDNTLVPWNTAEIPANLVRWYREVRRCGFNLCLVSNNKGTRVADFAKQLDAEAVGAAGKPRSKGFEEGMRRFRATSEETVMVGDQLLTDIFGGNRLGLYTILVQPIDSREWWGTKINRLFERFAVRVLLGRSGIPDGGKKLSKITMKNRAGEVTRQP